jgi:threonine synthase
MVVAVPDPAIISWQTSLARQGLYVEPTAAATFAGVEALARAGALGATVVAPLCGSGLKDVK